MRNKVISLSLIVLMLNSCADKMSNNDQAVYQPKEYVEISHPEWSKNASIYEVNIRQFTPEGTFRAFEDHLPRLKDLGVDIIWLMPIHPIGEKNRKGIMGSYYSVKDYFGVNPEFGDLNDLKHLVESAHNLGMYVIIDWVANHSSWDNPLTVEHPEWYSKDLEGNFQPTPWYDWDDIIDFDYEQAGLRKYMTQALKYWVSEADIDGYRCDVAGFIPIEFWENARRELDQIKPVFMLAEWESRDLHKKAFDMTYSWSLWEKMHAVVKEGKSPSVLTEYMAHDVSTFPRAAYRMNFTDNHDKNSWEGTQYEIFGEALKTAIAFSCTVNGMPLIYSGQEAGLDKRLKFFDKDLIEWKEHENFDLFKKLLSLKKKNQALWNGSYGGVMHRVYSSDNSNLIGFYREKNGDKLLAFFNFTDKKISPVLNAKFVAGEYIDALNSNNISIQGNETMELEAWSFKILSNR